MFVLLPLYGGFAFFAVGYLGLVARLWVGLLRGDDGTLPLLLAGSAAAVTAVALTVRGDALSSAPRGSRG